MDNLDSRFRPPSEDAQSLGFAESINFEDQHYVKLKAGLDSDAQNLEAESWSLTVDQNFLESLSKEAVKQQDVIYELIQTEMNLVRTLKIICGVYMRELKLALQMDDLHLERLFPAVGSLLAVHQHFLTALKELQRRSLQEGQAVCSVVELGNILISQFSGLTGEQVIQSYSVFCSQQSDALSFFKEQMQVNRKLQILIKRIDQLPLVQRRGVPECFLLVAQRITKYPVLVERILQNTEAETEEHRSLERALGLIKDAISQVDSNVCEHKKAARLKDIGHRLEGRPQSRAKEPCLFRREDLIQGSCSLLHEGPLTWKWSGKQKEVLAVLLSDMLLLLQEKEQKLVFASMENRVQVIPLQRLIVREVAMEEKAMYLIYVSTSAMPEMYELHSASKDECLRWMALIRRAVDNQQEEELDKEQVRRLQGFQDHLRDIDQQIVDCLSRKLKVSAEFYENLTAQKPPPSSLLLRGDTETLRGGALLNGAIDEVENLQNLLFMQLMEPSRPAEGGPPKEMRGEDAVDWAEPVEDLPLNHGEEPLPADASEDPEEPTPAAPGRSGKPLFQAGTEVDAPPKHRSSCSFVCGTAVCDSVAKLAKTLYSLKAVVAQQDSRIELQRAFQQKMRQPRHHSNLLLEKERQRNQEKQKEDLASLHKLREEQQRWEKERERQEKRAEVLEAQLLQREEECKRLEERLSEEKAELERQKEAYQQDLERLRETTRSVDRDRRQLKQDMDRVDRLRQKLLRVQHNYEDAALGRSPAPGAQTPGLSSKPPLSVNGGGLKGTLRSDDTPPKVPQRNESMRSRPSKQHNPPYQSRPPSQVQKPPVLQQKIPTKLAKGEKSFRGKRTHQRTQSAASIDVTEVLPIRPTAKEGGSLRAPRSTSPKRNLHPDTFRPPRSPQNRKRNSLDTPPPVPPPFPTEILEMGAEKLQTAL